MKQSIAIEVEIKASELREKLGVKDGAPGPQGNPGETPKVGTDYLTPPEMEGIKTEITEDVESRLPEKIKAEVKRQKVTPEQIASVVNELVKKQPPVKTTDVEGLTELFKAEIEKVYDTVREHSKRSGGGSLNLRSLQDIDFTTLQDSYSLQYDKETDRFFFGAGSGGGGGVTDHGALTGLLDDDHPQYHTDARGDARYSQLGHTHTASQVTDFNTASDSRIALHVAQADPHSQYQKESEKDAALGYAGLDAGGKINPSQLPAIAISDTFVVATQVAMLALTAQTGDVAVRSDLSQTFILRGSNPAVLGDWELLQTPTDTVTSVFGRVGPVTAQNGDYNTSQVTESSNLYFTEPRVRASLLTGLSLTAGIVAATDSILQAIGKIGAIVNALTGGTTGQVLKKNSNTAFDYSWQADNTGGGGGATATEVEIDFGTTTVPITSWTITDAGIDPTKKILVFPSPKTAMGRAGNDWEWDSAVFTGLAGTGNFALSAIPTTRMVGKRNIYYQVV